MLWRIHAINNACAAHPLSLCVFSEDRAGSLGTGGALLSAVLPTPCPNSAALQDPGLEQWPGDQLATGTAAGEASTLQLQVLSCHPLCPAPCIPSARCHRGHWAATHPSPCLYPRWRKAEAAGGRAGDKACLLNLSLSVSTTWLFRTPTVPCVQPQGPARALGRACRGGGAQTGPPPSASVSRGCCDTGPLVACHGFGSWRSPLLGGGSPSTGSCGGPRAVPVQDPVTALATCAAQGPVPTSHSPSSLRGPHHTPCDLMPRVWGEDGASPRLPSCQPPAAAEEPGEGGAARGSRAQACCPLPAARGWVLVHQALFSRQALGTPAVSVAPEEAQLVCLCLLRWPGPPTPRP